MVFSICAGSATTGWTSRLDDEAQFIHAGGIQRVSEGNADGVAVRLDRQAAVHARRRGRDDFEQLGRDTDIAQRDDLGAEMIRHHLEDGIQVEDAEILDDLDDRFARCA